MEQFGYTKDVIKSIQNIKLRYDNLYFLIRRTILSLTENKIKTSKVKDKNYTLSDTGGLQLLIKTNKSKLFEFRYISPVSKKRRKTSFGTYPKTTLKNARMKRDEFLELIEQGIDPIDYNKDKNNNELKKQNSIFKNLTQEWLSYEKERLSKRTFENKNRIIQLDIYPYFEDKYIEDITHQDIINLIQKRLSKNENNSSIETAKKLFQYLNIIFKYSITKGLIKRNICNDIVLDLIIPKHKTTHNPKITQEDEFKKLVNDIYFNNKTLNKNILKFALHIPLRASNLTNLKWEYINFDNCSLTIPRELMKIKDHNLPDFKVPLSFQVLKILQEQYELTSNSEFVFIGRSNNKPINIDTPNKILTSLGYKNKQTFHGLRGSCRSILETNQIKHNLSYEVKERFLDHQSTNLVERAYSHKADYFEQLKPLVKWWSEYIDSLVI